ncbi:MAG: efflux RND transporter periplasmic adaptor subunit [Cyclobacteriaceae bacterium]|nr:efflux RND transporter periplasmic adaptor subunit [Cyclobacteriaceae bacterium]
MNQKLLFISALGVLLLNQRCSSPESQPTQLQQLSVVKVLQQDVPLEKDFVGQVYGQSDITIRARVDGFLQGIHFQEGTIVQKNQLLYTIDEVPYRVEVARMESQLSEARVRAVNAGNELERLRPLVATSAISVSDYDAAVASKGSADEMVKAARSAVELSKINLGYCRITSPITGLIGKSEAKVGEYVGRFPNPVILNTVSSTDSIVVDFFLNERDYFQLSQSYRNMTPEERRNSKSTSPFYLILSDGSIFPHAGRFNFIDRGINPGTASILLQAIFPNPDRVIRPGQFARVRVTMSTASNALLIPQRCTIEVQGEFFVFVVDENGVINKQSVGVQSPFRDYYVIQSGIKAGDKILMDGLLRAQSGMQIDPQVVEFQSKANPQ